MQNERSLRRMVWRGVVSLVILTTGQLLSTSAQPEAFTYVIDPSIEPALPELPGLRGGPERPLAAVRLPSGVQEDFVVDEVILSTTDPAALDAFIGTYGAEILFGADLPDDPGNLPPDKLRSVEYATTEDYLLRVNLDAIDTAEFESWMTLLGFDGEYAFSSEEAVKLNAIIAKERLDDVEISYNPLSMLPPMDASVASSELPSASAAPASANCVMCSTQEYSKTATTYADGFSFSWLNDANLRATRAWQYYDLLELSPAPLPVLAMVDLGFALNADFDPPANIPQYDFMAEEYSVNNKANTIIGNKWHGTGTLGLAAARLNNQFGTAGTGGQIAYPYLFTPEWTLYGIARAIRTAVYWGADVVNVSAATSAGSMWHLFALTKASAKAQNASVIVLVTAGNEGTDTGSTQFLPCAVPGFMCIGGFDMATKQADSGSNYGSDIDAWGPYNGLATTPNPDYTGTTLPGFGGTCGASAYMAGIVTLMKGVNPNLNYSSAVSILHSTANPSTGKMAAAGGYVNAYAAVKAAATSAGHQAHGDTYEPNDTSATAHALSPGSTTATIAPNDMDYFAFTTTDLMDLQLRVEHDDHVAPNNGLNAKLDGNWGTDSSGTITLDRMLLPPGTHVLEIYGQSTDTINCYHIEFSMTTSSINPDAYDDQTPPGEPRNDTFANRAVIPGTVSSSVIIPMGQIADLNFDTIGDIDFFEITLDPVTDPTTGHAECLDPSDPRYSDPGFSQGRLVLSAWPDAWKPSTPGYNWPFEIKVYTATGSVYASATGLNLTIECPHDHFPDGKIKFSIQGKDGRRNYYRAFQHYSRWDVYYDIPIWMWTQTEPPLLRVLPPYYGWFEQMYPRNPEVIGQWFEGTPPDPMPPDYAAFHWEGGRPFDLHLSTQGERYMEVTLYNAGQEIIATTMVGDTPDLDASGEEGQIHFPELEPGTYILAFKGDFGTVYDVTVEPPFSIYLPLVLR